MNRYLEKVAELEKEALNALKARAMAHEAGVVVDPDTQWKWALRQFRGKRGELVQGRERSQVLDRLMGNPSAGNNNFRQAIQSEQRKLHPTDEVQLHRRLDNVVSRPRTVSRNLRSVKVSEGRYVGGYSDSDQMYGLSNLHTDLESVQRIGDRVHYTVKGKTPKEGGGLHAKDFAVKNSASDGRLEHEYEDLANRNLQNSVDTHIHPAVNRRIVRLNNYKYVPEEYTASKGGYSDAFFRHQAGQLHRKASPSGGFRKVDDGSILMRGRGDLNPFSSKGHIGIPHNIITTPYEDGKIFAGLHRVVPTTQKKYGTEIAVPQRLRSAYLDLTPRKARPANPYLDKLQDMGKTL